MTGECQRSRVQVHFQGRSVRMQRALTSITRGAGLVCTAAVLASKSLATNAAAMGSFYDIVEVCRSPHVVSAATSQSAQ